MMRPRRFVMVLAATAILGCGKEKKSKSACLESETLVFLYDGLASDETCKAILDAEETAVVGGLNAPVLVSPSDGGSVASGAADVTFTWTSAIDADGDLAWAPSPARKRPPADHPVTTLLRALQPVSTAWAHEPPVTGAVHRVVLSGPSGEIATLYTTRLHWTLSPELRATVLETEGTLELDLISVYLTENRILNPTTDGPFRMAAPTSFEVSP